MYHNNYKSTTHTNYHHLPSSTEDHSAHPHKLWRYPLTIIPQCGQRPHMIYNFTCISLYTTAAPLALKEAMRLGKTLQWTLSHIFNTDLALAPFYAKRDTWNMHTYTSGYSLKTCYILTSSYQRRYPQINNWLGSAYNYQRHTSIAPPTSWVPHKSSPSWPIPLSPTGTHQNPIPRKMFPPPKNRTITSNQYKTIIKYGKI